MRTRSITLAAAALAAALVSLGRPAPVAAQVTGPTTLSISVVGGQPEYADGFLPGQPIPVQLSLACGSWCQQTAEWWIWIEDMNDANRVYSYDGAAQRWVAGLAPSYVRPLEELPLAPLPGRLELPDGNWFLHFEVDSDPNGDRDVFSDISFRYEAGFDSYYLYYRVRVDQGFFDDFFDGKADGWGDDGSGAWSVAGRRYRLIADGAPAVFTSLHKGGFFDFTCGADVRLLSGGSRSGRRGFGLLFRASRGYRNGYVFHINADGNYLVFKRVAGRTRLLMPGWEQSAAIHRGAGAWNHLEVRAMNGQIEFRINGTVVRNLFDATFTLGRVGVKAFGDGGAGDRFEFDNVFLRVETD